MTSTIRERLHAERVVKFKRDGDVVVVTEKCDNYFAERLTLAETLQLADELRALAAPEPNYLGKILATGVFPCCDFCTGIIQSGACIAKQRAEYEHWAKSVEPPSGWTVLAYGDEIPAVHRVFYKNVMCWGNPKRCRSTMTPIWAKCSGWDMLWAIPTV